MIMTFTVKISKGREYLYFQAGRESMYISPKNKPERADQENVVKALEYAWQRAEHYLDAIDDLLPMLPEHLLKKHMAKKAALLRDRVTGYATANKKSKQA